MYVDWVIIKNGICNEMFMFEGIDYEEVNRKC